MTNRTKAITSLTSVFLIGGICGALIVGLVIRDKVLDARRLHDRQGFREYFVERLELTQSQRDSLQEELAIAYEDIEELRSAAIGEYDEVFDSLAVRLSPVLTLEQQELLDVHRKELLQQEKKEREDEQVEAVDDYSDAEPRDEEGVVKEAPSPEEENGLETPVSAGDADNSVQVEENDGNGSRAVTELNSAVDTMRAGLVNDVEDEAYPEVLLGEPGEDVPEEVTVDYPGIEKLAQYFRRRLQLTTEQTEGVREIIRETMEKNLRAREGLSGYSRLIRAAIFRHLRQMDEAIVKLLDSEQRQQYEKVRREFKTKLRKRMSRRHNRR